MQKKTMYINYLIYAKFCEFKIFWQLVYQLKIDIISKIGTFRCVDKLQFFLQKIGYCDKRFNMLEN